jgi:hypothetical protein
LLLQEVKKAIKEEEDEKQGFADRVGLYIPAVAEEQNDVSKAKKIKFGVTGESHVCTWTILLCVRYSLYKPLPNSPHPLPSHPTLSPLIPLSPLSSHSLPLSPYLPGPNPLKMKERKVKRQCILSASPNDEKRRDNLFKIQSKLDRRIFDHLSRSPRISSGGVVTVSEKGKEKSGVSQLRNRLGVVSKTRHHTHPQTS